MPAEKNRLLRVIVPIVVAAVGVVIIVSGYRNTTQQPGPKTTPTPTPVPVQAPSTINPQQNAAEQAAAPPTASPAQPADTSTPSTTSAATSSPAPGNQPQTPAAPPMLHARVQQTSAQPTALAPIGSLTPRGPDRVQLTFTLLGAGIESITTADYFEDIKKTKNYAVQQRMSIPTPSGSPEVLASLAARAVLIDGQLVDLFGSDTAPVWRETAPGEFLAEIVDAEDRPILRLTKRYQLQQGAFIFKVDQRAENLSARELTIEWVQYGPIELHEDITGYHIDMRRLRVGYLLEPSRDPSRQFVETDRKLTGRGSIIDRVAKRGDGLIWPRPADYKIAAELSWIAQTSRYFTFAVFPPIDQAASAANLASFTQSPVNKGLALASEVFAIVRTPFNGSSPPVLLLQMTSAPNKIAAGAVADLSFNAFAGPLSRRHLAASTEPVFGVLSMTDSVIYNLGGPCAWCTFQWLARLLLWFLSFLHDNVVFDWAIAIMILVVCVRTILHPITRRSQISLARFSKQMQALAPKQQKIREKFKDDPKRMQQEMIQLMREEKVNYSGALGCLPMFLQSPIWIALYAMLYFLFDLRHEPAFFGVFQAATAGSWTFLSDLSAGDKFIDFGGTLFSLPLLGDIRSINILPLLLGVLFYIQQKYLTPAPTTQLSPEQEMQMKMMKFMTVVMFPVFMYNAPSGLVIYFLTNSSLGILESRWIRAHIEQLDRAAPAGPRPDEPLGRRKVDNTAPRTKNRPK